ncbi:MAG: hypothetical protein HN576_08555 [Bacteriovoracaceae bacterium]|jgi:hypothetical protein|nr:hypothetical protein [Bacteriovoracaceae bacterium]
MQFSKVVFYSKDSAGLSQFLNEIFDTDIEYIDEVINHQCEFIKFEIRHTLININNNAAPHEQKLKFTVSGPGEMAAIKQKIEFFCYRQNMNISDLIIDQSLNHLLIRDPDGREWDFSDINQI